MASSKELAIKPTGKRTGKPSAVSTSIIKPFKSAELIHDSDDSDIGAGNTAVRSNAITTKSIDTTPAQGRSLKSRTSSLKPTAKRTSPTPSEKNSGLEKRSAKESASKPHTLRNGTAKAQQRVPTDQSSTTTRPSLERKRPSGIASVTDSSEDEAGEDISYTPAKRQKPNQPPKTIPSEAKPTAPLAKTSRQEASATHGSEESEASQQRMDQSSGTETEEEETSGSERPSGSSEDATVMTSKKTSVQPSLLPYQPPPGFEAVTISSHASASHTELFSPSNLEGKQIWHITTPNTVPVSSITSVAKQSVQDGSAIISHKGADYGLISETAVQGGDQVLLLPSEEDSRYKSASIGIAKTLHLRQLVRLSSIAHDVGAEDAGTQVGGTVNVRKPYSKPVPEQPEGLKMRYKPIGVSDSDDSDTESRLRSVKKAPQFRVPGLPASSQSPKKRKHDESKHLDADDGMNPKKKSAKVAFAPESRSTPTNGSTVSQKPQKIRSSQNEASGSVQSKDGSITSSINSKPSQQTSSGLKSAEPQKNEHLAPTVNDKSSSPAQGPAKKRKKRRTEDDIPANPESDQVSTAKPSNLAKSTLVSRSAHASKGTHSVPSINGASSSPLRISSKKQKTHLTDNSTSMDTNPTSTTTTNGHTTDQSFVQTAQPSSTPVKPEGNGSNKKRRKHRSAPTANDKEQVTAGANDTTTQVTEPPSEKHSSQIKASLPATSKPDAKPALTNGTPITPPHESETASSQPLTVDAKKGKLSKKSKIEGETVEERKIRRAEKKKRKEEARANAA